MILWDLNLLDAKILNPFGISDFIASAANSKIAQFRLKFLLQ